MDFIKKHYEKLILLLLLVIFIASMFHLLNIVKQTGEIQDHHLQIPTRDPDYKIHSPDDPVFDVVEQLKSTSLNWIEPGPRNPANAEHYSDLTYVFAISRCPFCGKLIPRSYMKKKELCPFCKNEKIKGVHFAEPPDDDYGDVFIPDEVKTKYQISLTDPDASYYDLDRDGFSNIYEYWKKTDLGDPRNHPPLWQRLRVIDVGKITLPNRLMVLNTLNNEDPKTWELQINNGRFNDLYMVGNELEIEHKFFRIVNAEQKFEPADDKGVRKDVSRIYLKEIDGDREITMVIGEPLHSFDDKAILEDSANPQKRMTLSVGDSFTLGNYMTGTESYRIKSFDPTEKTVLLENPSAMTGDATKGKDGIVMKVTPFGQIPRLMKVRVPKVNEGYGPEGPYYPGAPGMPARPSRVPARGRR